MIHSDEFIFQENRNSLLKIKFLILIRILQETLNVLHDHILREPQSTNRSNITLTYNAFPQLLDFNLKQIVDFILMYPVQIGELISNLLSVPTIQFTTINAAHIDIVVLLSASLNRAHHRC